MEKFKDIEKIIKTGVDNNDFPGGHYCYIVEDKIKCNYYGYKMIEPSKQLLTGDEIYDIASLSKIVSTTTIIFKLIENNQLSLNTKVKDILKDYFDPNTEVIDLLLHRSGLNPIVHNAISINTKEQLIKQIYDERFVYEPKTKIAYSDTGYMLLGFIIEKITNKKLKDVAHELVFKPLEMTNTSYNPDVYKAVVTEYRDDKLHKGFVKGFVHDERSYLMEGNSGHAGVFSTAKDISKYIYSVLHDERVFKNETKNLIFNTTVKSTDLQDNEVVRSLGYQKFSFLPDTHNYLITHTGFTGCNMWIDIKNKRGFVLLSNAVHPLRSKNKIFPYRKQILDLFYK